MFKDRIENRKAEILCSTVKHLKINIRKLVNIRITQQNQTDLWYFGSRESDAFSLISVKVIENEEIYNSNYIRTMNIEHSGNYYRTIYSNFNLLHLAENKATSCYLFNEFVPKSTQSNECLYYCLQAASDGATQFVVDSLRFYSLFFSIIMVCN